MQVIPRKPAVNLDVNPRKQGLLMESVPNDIGYLPDFYEFWKVLEQHKVNFVSATQSFDTSTPMGMLMLNMLLSFGQFERETIAERISHKIAERAKKGMWNGGWAPFGYAHDPVSKKITPDPVEGPIAKRVFELAKELHSPAKVAATLNAEGLRTSERVVQTRRGGEKLVGGKRFIPYKIKRIVSNPLYKGVIRHKGNDHPAEHPALVTAKLWQEANDALNGKGRVGRAIQERDTHQTLLKGLLRCGVCGHRLTPKPGGKKDKNGNPYLYYTCNNVSKDGRHSSSNSHFEIREGLEAGMIRHFPSGKCTGEKCYEIVTVLF